MKPLIRLAPFDEKTGDLTVIIETPRESRYKYGYDEETNGFALNFVLPEGMSFPYDFGFVPSTAAEDGDPVDVLVLMDSPAFAGCIIRARLVGGIQAMQREGSGQWVRNDRLVAVAARSRLYGSVQSLDDLRPNLLDEVEAFFGHYNRLNGKEFKPDGRCGPDEARRLVEVATRSVDGSE